MNVSRRRRKDDGLEATCYHGITLNVITNYLNHPGGSWARSFISNLNIFSLLTHLIPTRLDVHIRLNFYFFFSFSTLPPISFHFCLLTTFGMFKRMSFLDTYGALPLRWEGAAWALLRIATVLQKLQQEILLGGVREWGFESTDTEANRGHSTTNSCLSFNLVFSFKAVGKYQLSFLFFFGAVHKNIWNKIQFMTPNEKCIQTCCIALDMNPTGIAYPLCF